jgi:hypothetical protein
MSTAYNQVAESSLPVILACSFLRCTLCRRNRHFLPSFPRLLFCRLCQHLFLLPSLHLLLSLLFFLFLLLLRILLCSLLVLSLLRFLRLLHSQGILSTSFAPQMKCFETAIIQPSRKPTLFSFPSAEEALANLEQFASAWKPTSLTSSSLVLARSPKTVCSCSTCTTESPVNEQSCIPSFESTCKQMLST